MIDAFASAFAVGGARWLLAGAYLAGSIPFGYLLARLVANKDVRAAGSGNIGATNVARVVGKKLGILTLVLDALKGAVPVLLVVPLLSPTANDAAVLEASAGLCALAGHCFPVWLGFRGGKGVATGAGFLVAHLPEIAAVGLVVFGLVYAAKRMVSLASLAAGLAAAVAVLLLRPFDVSLVPLGAMLAIVVVRHTSNIKRMLKRQELKV